MNILYVIYLIIKIEICKFELETFILSELTNQRNLILAEIIMNQILIRILSNNCLDIE